MTQEKQLTRTGLAHHQSGEVEEAHLAYRKAIELNPLNADALHLLGLLLFEQGEHHEAADLITKSIAIRPDAFELQNSLGVVEMARGNYEAAKSSFQQVIASDPSLADPHRNIGQLLTIEGDLLLAEESLREAYRLDPLDPQTIECQFRLSKSLRTANKRDDAHRILKWLNQKDPDNLDVLQELAELESEIGDSIAAIEKYQCVLKRAPMRRRTLFAMAGLCERVGETDRTVETCVQILKSDSTSVAAHVLLAIILSSRLKPEHRTKLTLHQRGLLSERALGHARQAVRLEPAAETFDALGRVLMRCGRHSEAIEMLEQSIELDPGFSPAHENLGQAWLELGNLETAREHFATAATINPKSCVAQYELARLDKGQGSDEIAKLRFLLGSQHLSSYERMKLLFALARRLEAAGNFDDAFECFSLGNLEKSKLKKRPSTRRMETFVSQLIEIFDKNYFPSDVFSESRSEKNDIAPVFIVGMPRSGTSLIEQIVASHRNVFGAGELSYVGDIANSLSTRFGVKCGYPESALELNCKNSFSIREEYLLRVSQLIPNTCIDVRFVTDKMPMNFQHLGLIATIFPNAKIVHLMRNPIDVCVSCFKQNLEWPFCDLKETADYLNQYRRLMSHWHETLPLSIHEVRYENVVCNVERESRRLIDFIGLPWDPACLDFASLDRPVQTPSKWQVRQKIYNSSVGSWKNYEKHLIEIAKRFGSQST